MRKLLFFLFVASFQIYCGALTAQPNLRLLKHIQAEETVNGFAFEGSVLWYTSWAGLTKFDTITKTAYTYNYENSAIPYSIDRFGDIVIDHKGVKWISRLNSLLKFDGITWTEFNSTNTPGIQGIYCLALDSLDQLWISSSRDIAKFDGVTYTNYSYPCCLSFFISDILIKNNIIWCSTSNGLLCFDGNSWQFFNTSNSNISEDNLLHITMDTAQNIWVLYIDGFSKFDGINFINYSIPYGDGGTFAFDDSSNLWITKKVSQPFATGSNKITKFDGTNISKIDSSAFGNRDNLNCVKNINGTIWITADHLLSYKNGVWNSFYHRTNILRDAITDMIVDRDSSLWITDGELIHNKESHWDRVETYKILTQRACKIKIDSSGVKWIGCINGLVRYDGINPPTTILNNIRVRDLLIDSIQNIWILVEGTYASLLYYNHLSVTEYNHLNSPFQAQYAKALGMDWFGKIYVGTTYDGLFTFDGTNWENFTTANSPLPDNDVEQIKVDSQNSIYIYTAGGLIKKIGNSWINIFSGWAANSLTIDKYDNVYFGNLYYNGLTVDTISNLKKMDGGITFYNSNKLIAYGYPGLYYYSLNDNAIAHYTNIIGNVFYDGLNNGIYDSLDRGMFNQRIILLPDSEFTYTNGRGIYSFAKTDGNYTVEFLPHQNWVISSDTISYHLNLGHNDLTGNDYQTYSILSEDSVDINITAGILRCGNPVPFYINYSNKGSKIVSGRIIFKYDSYFSYSSSSSNPVYINPDTLIWDFVNLFPGEQRKILVTLLPSSSIPIGSTAFFEGWINIPKDSVLVYTILSGMLVCSLDPNDKLVSPVGSGPNHETHFNQPFEYTVRFQNCGNDTAFFIEIVDTLDKNLDLSTFEFLASSHDVYPALTNQGILKFRFDSIFLPCKTTNETGSQGFVKYRIQHKAGLPDPTVIKNFAGIYFDYNPPIYTNKVFNTLTNSFTGIETIYTSTDRKIKIYPNPASNQLTIEPFDNGDYSMNVFDISGKIQLYDKISGRKTIDVSSLNTGIYFFQLLNKNGERSCGRFVIAR